MFVSVSYTDIEGNYSALIGAADGGSLPDFGTLLGGNKLKRQKEVERCGKVERDKRNKRLKKYYLRGIVTVRVLP